MRIGELSKLSGLSRDTIRFYEKQQLIGSEPSTSSQNNYRDYPQDLVERLDIITEARDAGMSIADLRILLDCMECRSQEILDVEDFLADRVTQVEATIRRSRRFLKTLKDTQKAMKP
ncbi:MAG: MerR family transcriptional regulator [Rhodobacteraceae bacterium]|nr:MerR family transcriptional regulator [Paracoccaceae bacterium]